MKMISIVKARWELSNLLAGYNVPENMLPLIQNLHDLLLAEERKNPEAEAKAFAEIAGPRNDWEIA